MASVSGDKRGSDVAMEDAASDGLDGAKTTEEDDLLLRSTKKPKEVNENFTREQSGTRTYGDIAELSEPLPVSYSQALLGVSFTRNWEEDDSMSETDNDNGSSAGDSDSSLEFGKETCKIIEHDRGNISIPEFVFTKNEEKRICYPFKKALIVKLLGRMIWLKALDNRVQKMWAKYGIVSVVDMVNDFFLVKFTNDNDFNFALEGGPWMIYDHYVMVRS